MKVAYIILSCEAYLPTRGKAQRETWLTTVDEYWFLSAKENREERVLGWDTADTYESCADKYEAFFRSVDLDADWIIFVDDDTFVYPRRLEAYLEQYDPSALYYIGRRISSSSETSMSGGAGFVLSRGAYTRVCELIRTQTLPRVSTYGDLTVHYWLKHLQYVQAITDGRFNWKNATSLEEQDTAFTFHYVSPSQMRSYFTERKMDISILIPTMTPRKALFERVLAEVYRQANECWKLRTEILWESDNGELTLGQKRNVLMDRCSGKYHCFIDDDDVLAPDYLKTFVPMITSGVDYDCASFVGAHYQRGVFNKLFHHSMDYREWDETPERYIRTVSPMNLIKTDIVRQVRYKDIRNTEDHEFSKRLMASGLLKTEFRINPNYPVYHYIDGVKQDRESWRYEWKTPDRLHLWKQPSYDFHAHFGSSSSQTPLSFLRFSRP
jgi:hypothetical protein